MSFKKLQNENKSKIIFIQKFWTIKKTLNFLKSEKYINSILNKIYIVDPKNNKLISEILFKDIIIEDPNKNILSAAHNIKPIAVKVSTDKKIIANIFYSHDVFSIPIIDNFNHIIGIITLYDILDHLKKEIVEKNVSYKFNKKKTYLQTSILKIIKKRWFWLCLMFLGEMLTTSAMQYFEYKLEKLVVLTLFIPLIMSSAGNSVAQGTTLIIRALALNEINLKDWWKIVIKELIIGFFLGSIIAIIAFIRIIIWQYAGIYNYGKQFILIGIIISCSLIIIISLGSLIGSISPFFLKIIKCDPASASIPFVTTLVDVLGIIIYLSIANIIFSSNII